MAVFTHIETDSGTNADISSATAIGAYTATADKLVMVDVSIDQVAGDGDYVMYVTRQIGGSGSAYRILPQTTMTAASGLTAISGQSGWITVKSGDVLTVYVDGLAGDTTTPDWTTRWFEDSGTAGVLVASLATDSITADALKADAVTKIQNGLATSSALATVDGIVDDILVDTSTTLDGKLNTVDTVVDAIKAKTDNLPTSPAPANEYDAELTAIQTDLDNPDQYKADVSSLAKATDLQDVEDKIDVIATDTTTEIPATLATLATSAALATVDANVDSVLADTNEIQAELADGGRTDLLIDSIVGATTATGVLLKDTAIEAIFNDVVVTGTYTFAQLMKIMASALAGKLSGGGSTTLTFKSVDGASDVIVATVDANGNRSAVTLTV
jgi:hypothetical protein